MSEYRSSMTNKAVTSSTSGDITAAVTESSGSSSSDVEVGHHPLTVTTKPQNNVHDDDDFENTQIDNTDDTTDDDVLSKDSKDTTSSTSSHSEWIWLHAFYHSIVTIIGTGILGFPYATRYLGYAGGSIMITLVTIGCLYTANLLIDLQSPSQGTYTEVADAIMGQGWSNYGVKPFQLLNFFPTAGVMILVGGTAMYTLDGLDGSQSLEEREWTAIMGAIVLLLSLLPDLAHVWQLSALGCVAAFMIIGYSVAGSSVAIAEDFQPDVFDSPQEEDDTVHHLFKITTAFGEILFGYGFHAVLPDIQASLHDHSSTDSHKDTKKAVAASFAISGPAYLTVAMIGYAAFGSSVQENVLLNINDVLSSTAMYIIWLFVAIKTASEGAVFNQAAFTLIRDALNLTEKSDHIDHHPKNWTLDWVIRGIYVVLATLVAMFIPYFGDLTAVTGALSITPLSFIVPIILWNNAHREDAPMYRILLHRLYISICFVVATLALIGACYDIVISARDGTN